MSKLSRSSTLGASRGKLILIAVLAVILVLVVAVQFGGKSGAKETTESESADEASAPEPAAQPSAADDEAAPKRPQTVEISRPWPEWKLADVLEHDPFATPELLGRRDNRSDRNADLEREAEAAARREAIAQRRAEQDRLAEQLQKEGVRALVGSSRNGRAAIVGSKTVRVGDVLGEFQVIAIEPDGVVLERLKLE
jgi:hypothetical protein